MTEEVVDGRVARGQRTREAVIDTLFDLYAEGNLTPTIEQIAARVGRTTRSIYHHFQDKEALAVAIAERQLERHRELLTAGPVSGTRTERVDGIARHRAELFEAVAPARRSALVRMHLSPEIQNQQTFLAAHLRNQIARTFEPELSLLDPDAADEVLELLDLHTSWETWDRLRTRQRLSVERSRQLVTGLVIRTLER
jgi:AcrR family transcriptional regulator|tara:strand:+ start:533 stop:1123 length:591 start_codon:yes stop_codon:yes gene_type:complete